jgi:4,5-dihydroxyphthalate decarboxylase
MRTPASGALQVTYAGVPYLDRVAPLAHGEVEIPGVCLSFVEPHDLGDLFRVQARDPQFEASEMSLATYLALVGHGHDHLVGLPIFPLRQFRHRHVYVHAEAGIEKPEDLRGKRVGVPEYEMTSALWIRAFLLHDYNIRPEELHWHVGGLRTPGYRRRTEHNRPDGVTIDVIRDSETLEKLLLRGALEALVTVEPPADFGKSPAIRRLFSDYEAVEREYYERTGLFPIMHLVVIRRTLYEQAPWLGGALVAAFSAAKTIGMRRLKDADRLAVALPWLQRHVEETEQIFGSDGFPYGLDVNRHLLEQAVRFAHEQQLVPQPPSLEELFPTTV